MSRKSDSFVCLLKMYSGKPYSTPIQIWNYQINFSFSDPRDQVLEPSEEPQLLSSHVPTVSEISMPGDLITMAFPVCIFEGCHHPGDSHPTKGIHMFSIPSTRGHMHTSACTYNL